MTTQLQFRRSLRMCLRANELWSVLLAGILITGCLSKPTARRQTFAFQNASTSESTSATGIVASCSVAVSPLFSGKSFVYRIGPEAYEWDPYAEFIVVPAQTLALAARAHLLSSGRFQNLVEPGSSVKAGKSIEVYVSELYGDFRRARESAAVLSMRISLFDEEAAKPWQPLMQKDYSRHVPLRENTATAVMSGWGTALNEIMTEAAADLTRPK